MALSDIVDVSISTETAVLSQAGFGIPLILSPHALNADRIRFYEDVAGMVTDGFTTTSPEYLAAAAMFAQSPKPEQVAVGRLANKPTQRWRLTPIVANSTAYTVKVNGTAVTYTSDASATAAEIIAGLKTAIDALSLGITTSDQTSYLRIVANAAGAWFRIESTTIDTLQVLQDHADPGVAADLSAIQLVDDTWYAILNLFNSKDMVMAIAAWAETAKKLFLPTVNDTFCLTTESGSLDVGTALVAAAYRYTAPAYHPDNGSFLAEAWAGRCLPLDPGSETWKFKQLSGVATVNLTSTHRTNLKAKRINHYYSVGGRGITAEGVVSANEFIDIIRGVDWLHARLAERIFARLSQVDKIPYTNAGVAVIEGEVRAQLDDGIDVGFLREDPAPFVTVPKVADIDDADRAARLLPDITFGAEAAGAIHKVELRGTISV